MCVCVYVRTCVSVFTGRTRTAASAHGKRIDDNKLCPLTWPSMLHCCQCRAAASLYYYWRANCSASECARRVRKLSNPGARQRFKLCIPKHTHTHTDRRARARARFAAISILVKTWIVCGTHLLGSLASSCRGFRLTLVHIRIVLHNRVQNTQAHAHVMSVSVSSGFLMKSETVIGCAYTRLLLSGACVMSVCVWLLFFYHFYEHNL